MPNFNDNTTGLQQILETVNALPDAGSGGGGSVLPRDSCIMKLTKSAGIVAYNEVCEKNAATNAYTSYTSMRYFSASTEGFPFPVSQEGILTDSIIVTKMPDTGSASFSQVVANAGVDIVYCSGKLLIMYVHPDATSIEVEVTLATD